MVYGGDDILVLLIDSDLKQVVVWITKIHRHERTDCANLGYWTLGNCHSTGLDVFWLWKLNRPATAS
jgi:hypothetical protein